MKQTPKDGLAALYNERDRINTTMVANRSKPPMELETRLESYELNAKLCNIESSIEAARGKPREAIRWAKEGIQYHELYERTIAEDQSARISEMMDVIRKLMKQQEIGDAFRSLADDPGPDGTLDEGPEVMWEDGDGRTFEEWHADMTPDDVLLGATLTATPAPDEEHDPH